VALSKNFNIDSLIEGSFICTHRESRGPWGRPIRIGCGCPSGFHVLNKFPPLLSGVKTPTPVNVGLDFKAASFCGVVLIGRFLGGNASSISGIVPEQGILGKYNDGKPIDKIRT
jgi:hypothetical protein